MVRAPPPPPLALGPTVDGVPGREVVAGVKSRLGSCLVPRMVEGEAGGGSVVVVVLPVPDRPNAKYERYDVVAFSSTAADGGPSLSGSSVTKTVRGPVVVHRSTRS